MKKRIIWGFIFCCFALIIFILFTMNNKPPRKFDNKTIYKIGEKIDIGGKILTVTKANLNWRSTNLLETPASEDSVFVVVDVTIENKSLQEIPVNLANFYLFDSRGAKIQNNSLVGMNLKKLVSSNLKPKSKTSGSLIWEIEKIYISNLLLIYNPDITNNTTEVKIKLN